MHTLFVTLHHICLLNVCLVNRNPHKPCHLQRLTLQRPLLHQPQRRNSESPQTHPLPPLRPCCVSFRRPSTGRLLPCSSPSPQPGHLQPGENSSQDGSSLALQRDSPLRCCTRLWTWSTSTGALRTMSTVTTLMASTALSRTGTEMTDCCRPCLRW